MFLIPNKSFQIISHSQGTENKDLEPIRLALICPFTKDGPTKIFAGFPSSNIPKEMSSAPLIQAAHQVDPLEQTP